MVLVLLIMAGIVVVCLFGAWAIYAHQREQLEVEKQNKGFISKGIFYYLEGIPGFNDVKKVSIYIYPEKITFKEMYYASEGDKEAVLPSSRVNKSQVVYEDKVTEKNKSIIKRAIAGGLILGPTGAIVGGMTGMGKKEETERICLLAINYLDKDGQEKDVILYEKIMESLNEIPVTDDIRTISENINKMIGYEDEKAKYDEITGEYEI